MRGVVAAAVLLTADRDRQRRATPPRLGVAISFQTTDVGKRCKIASLNTAHAIIDFNTLHMQVRKWGSTFMPTDFDASAHLYVS